MEGKNHLTLIPHTSPIWAAFLCKFALFWPMFFFWKFHHLATKQMRGAYDFFKGFCGGKIPKFATFLGSKCWNFHI
jgi:hypothetical protein